MTFVETLLLPLGQMRATATSTAKPLQPRAPDTAHAEMVAKAVEETAASASAGVEGQWQSKSSQEQRAEEL